jgi:hypothetical protein
MSTNALMGTQLQKRRLRLGFFGRPHKMPTLRSFQRRVSTGRARRRAARSTPALSGDVVCELGGSSGERYARGDRRMANLCAVSSHCAVRDEPLTTTKRCRIHRLECLRMGNSRMCSRCYSKNISCRPATEATQPMKTPAEREAKRQEKRRKKDEDAARKQAKTENRVVLEYPPHNSGAIAIEEQDMAALCDLDEHMTPRMFHTLTR